MMLLSLRSRLRTCCYLGVLTALFAFASQAEAYSHQYINLMRSGAQNNLFVHQAVEAEFGSYSLDLEEGPLTQAWAGYGVRNAFGVELMKFVQFSANHTFVNMSNKDSGNDRLNGSRVAGEVKFAFSAPICNLEMGGGAVVSRYDYQRELKSSSLYGTGLYYLLGVNYFLSSRVSFFGQLKNIEEGMTRGSGSPIGGEIKARTTSVGTGFSIWL